MMCFANACQMISPDGIEHQRIQCCWARAVVIRALNYTPLLAPEMRHKMRRFDTKWFKWRIAIPMGALIPASVCLRIQMALLVRLLSRFPRTSRWANALWQVWILYIYIYVEWWSVDGHNRGSLLTYMRRTAGLGHNNIHICCVIIYFKFIYLWTLGHCIWRVNRGTANRMRCTRELSVSK